MCRGIGRTAIPLPLSPRGKIESGKKEEGRIRTTSIFSNNSNRRRRAGLLLPFASGVSNNSRGSRTAARFVVSRARFMAVGPRFVRSSRLFRRKRPGVAFGKREPARMIDARSRGRVMRTANCSANTLDEDRTAHSFFFPAIYVTGDLKFFWYAQKKGRFTC